MEDQVKQNQHATTEEVDIETMFAKLKESENTNDKSTEKSSEEIIQDFFPSGETTPAVKKEPEATIITNEENAPIVDNQLHNKVVDYINNGFIEDIELEIGEGEDVKKVFLSEMKDIDEDTLKYIITEQKKSKEDDLKEKYISTEGLDDRTKKMIELKKAGGDLTELIREEVNYTHALAGLDLDSEKVQENLVRQKLQSQGLRPKVIDAEIEAMKEEMTLDLEAKQIVDDYNKHYEKFVEDKKAEQLEFINKAKEEQKEFKKNINTTLREYNLPENISKVVLDNTTKVDEYGLTNTDKLYFDSKKDPQLHTEIAFFLNNRDEFKKLIAVSAKNKATVDQIQKVIKINPKNIKTEISAPATDEQKREEQLKEFFKQ